MHNEGKAKKERKEDEKGESFCELWGLSLGWWEEEMNNWEVEVWLATEKETKAGIPFIVPRKEEFILKSVFIFSWLYKAKS